MRYSVIAILLFSVSIAFAHGNAETANLPDPTVFLYYTVWISGLAVTASLLYRMNKIEKKIIFVLIAVPVGLSTLYLSGHTIYINLVSETGGPVHWHADYEVWSCGTKLDLVDPTGLENRVGSPVFHEHNDDRIHVEGVLVNTSDARLEEYFEVIGGKLTENAMFYPANDGVISVKNGGSCNGKTGALQAFVYKTSGKKFRQEKLTDFPHYVISPHSQVPPGDCIIIEFGEEKNVTDKLCATYRVAKMKGDLVEG